MIRIGDLIEERAGTKAEQAEIAAREYLEQTVFDPTPYSGSIADWYQQSRPVASRNSFRGELSLKVPRLGAFENLMVEKALDPKRAVVCVVGPMGCGKSTFANYVLLDIVGERQHCGKCSEPRSRLVAHIDFNDHITLSSLDGEKLDSSLLSILCLQLRARLATLPLLAEVEELTLFWKREIGAFSTEFHPSKAFSLILGEIGDATDMVFDPEELSTSDLRKRQNALEKLAANPEHYLDYLVRLWRYVLDEKYDSRRGCAFIVLDNIDRVAPAVQRRLVELVVSSAHRDGPTFVLLCREETFDYIGLSASIIDHAEHKGPTPWVVVKSRLREFWRDGGKFFDDRRSLTEEDFLALQSFFHSIRDLIKEDRREVLQRFFRTASGRSIRSALLIAQAMFRVPAHDMAQDGFTIHDLVRILITRGETQLRWTLHHPIMHMFRTAVPERNDLLVKPRILRFLDATPGRTSSLNEIYHSLQGFGYSGTLVRTAMNELLNPGSQLLRTNGFDAYHDEEALLRHRGDTVVLTDMGKGYIRDLLGNVHYVQEVMLDSYVKEDRFPKQARFQYLSDKLRLLYSFLDEIRDVDRAETRQFVEGWDVEAFEDAFGRHLVSLDMIHRMYEPILRILAAYAKGNPSVRHECGEIAKDFESLVLLAEHNNNELLDLAISSITTDVTYERFL